MKLSRFVCNFRYSFNFRKPRLPWRIARAYFDLFSGRRHPSGTSTSTSVSPATCAASTASPRASSTRKRSNSRTGNGARGPLRPRDDVPRDRARRRSPAWPSASPAGWPRAACSRWKHPTWRASTPASSGSGTGGLPLPRHWHCSRREPGPAAREPGPRGDRGAIPDGHSFWMYTVHHWLRYGSRPAPDRPAVRPLPGLPFLAAFTAWDRLRARLGFHTSAMLVIGRKPGGTA